MVENEQISLSLISMGNYKIKLHFLSVAFLTMASTIALSIEHSSNILAPYNANIAQKKEPVQIFKYIDDGGKITYSSIFPHDIVDVDEMSPVILPSVESVDDARKINESIKSAANSLSNAREKREAIRAEKEKIETERLRVAQVDQPKALDVQPRFIHITRPHRKTLENREVKMQRKTHSVDRIARFSTHRHHLPSSNNITHRLHDKN